MPLSDRVCGSLMLLFAAVTFLYYTLWTMLLPFFDADSPIHDWFPAREWALRIISLIVALGISAIGLFLGTHIITDGRDAKQRGMRKKLS